MDLVSVQLGHGIPDGLYDVQTGHGYTYPSHVWPSIRDSDRGFQTQPQGQGVDSTVRQSDQSRNTKRHSQMENTSNADCADWNTDGEDSKTFETSSNDQNSQKQSQVSATLKWLTENYERAEGVCLPRCVLYTHYLDFCKKMKFTPAGAATFGKIIRQKFPKLTTRRLGTRGQSKYHYYGIGIKETSIYYHSVYSGKGLTRFSGIKIKTEGSNRKYSLSSKTGTLLPEFPDSNNFILPENMDKEKMQTFIMMYRTHCQRILDTIISANFDEVQNFLLHFWQGMPEHLTDLLEFDLVVDIVGLCDSILYKVLIDVLIPSTIQDLPESLGTEIKLFTKRLPYWLSNSLENVPESLRQKKMEVVKSFIQSIRRQISFVHLAQTARTVLLNHDTINQMNEDVADINFIEICCRASFIEPSTTSKFKETILDFFDEFQNLLSKQAPIEAYTEWLDNIIDKCVLQSKKDSSYKFKDRASFFLLQWAIFGSLLMRDLTLHSASSFGSFHLIHMMLDEYVFLVMETQHDLNKEEILQRNVQCHMKNAEEINMSAKIRTPSNKGHLQNSPKTRKRKLSEGHYDSGDDADISRSTDENRLTVAETYTPVNGTAFSRPPPSHNRELASYPYVEDSRPVVSHATLPLSPLKHYPSLNSGPYDRPTYLPQYGLNSYNDLMNGGNSFSSSRIPSYADTHSQSFNSAPFSNNVSQTMGTYLSDTRQHSTVHDPYHYSYNKFHPTYDTYNKSIIRGGPYQEAFNRSAFDTSRSYYRSAHDNLHAVASHLSVGGFNNTYMDIAQPGTQYARQDPVLYQDDLYQSAMTSSFPAFGKSYLTASFR